MANIIVWKGFELEEDPEQPNSYRYTDDQYSFYLAFDVTEQDIQRVWSASVQIGQIMEEDYSHDPHIALTKALLNVYQELLQCREVIQELAKLPV